MAIVPNEPRPPYIAIAIFAVGFITALGGLIVSICGALVGIAGLIH